MNSSLKRFRYLTHQNFSKHAKKMRGCFESIFKNVWNINRFCWDYFFVPNQYRLMRTWADEFFPKIIYEQFQKELSAFGLENFGCDGTTRPWVSFYVDGCYQNFHADVPHGPLAFVYSLTPSTKFFSGGETLLFQDTALDYWKNFEQMFGVESDSLFEKVSPKFNQLLVFDPKIPHGVQEVKGTHDPLEGRLVIHGWFANPQPRIQGPRANKNTQKLLNEVILSLNPLFEEYPHINGFLSLKFEITAKGTVKGFQILIHTLVETSQNLDLKLFLKNLENHFQNLKFQSIQSKTSTKILLPLLFQST